MQEAYRLRRIKYSICCPIQGGIYPGRGGGVPILAREGTYPGWGVPPSWGTFPCPDLGLVTGVPPRKDMGPVEVLWDRDGVSPRCGQTENITSHLVQRTRSVIIHHPHMITTLVLPSSPDTIEVPSELPQLLTGNLTLVLQ